ncbi:MAG TPA: ATP-dependent helicase, partial [Candidatus Cloacimonadota bacterium]|nr:ATP-dependent helicase [Candidatus Cloacimonadota bacterium]
MARLFSKDYHLLSTSWYFNHAVIALAQGDLWYWHTLDEAGNYRMRFFPSQDKREHFSAYVDVVYDPRQGQIISHQCHECRGEEGCRHYLSLLRYAYFNLSTDIFDQAPVLTCDGDSLRGDVQWLNLAHEARIRVEGIFDPGVDKIRFYHKDYKALDMPALLSALQEDKAAVSGVENNLGVFSVYELQLFEFLHAHRAAYSPKGGFWSLYKRDFAASLTLLEHLGGRVIISESSEPLIFAKEPYPLALRIEPAGKENYRLNA